MNIEINNKTRSRIDLNLIKRVVERFLKYYKKRNHEVSIAFVGDKTIRKLNKKYRGIDRVTDVLSFKGEDNFLGEIIINYQQVRRQARQFGGQAKKFGNKPKDELVFILVHGLLHLLGYDDETGEWKKKMEKLGEEFIKISNF